jgi:GNAT superfamily N-acetyltransferase
MILRDARPAERDVLEALQRRAALMWDAERPYLLANPDVIELPLAHIQEGRVRVAEQDGEPLGFAVLLRRADGALMESLFVEPKHWRRGIGRLLVEDAVRRAGAADFRTLAVVASSQALGFYRQLGFVPDGQVETAFGPAQRLVRALKTA